MAYKTSNAFQFLDKLDEREIQKSSSVIGGIWEKLFKNIEIPQNRKISVKSVRNAFYDTLWQITDNESSYNKFKDVFDDIMTDREMRKRNLDYPQSENFKMMLSKKEKEYNIKIPFQCKKWLRAIYTQIISIVTSNLVNLILR